MLSFYKKYWRTAFDIGLIALTVYLIMFVFSFLYNIATPIFLSFIVFFIIEPFAKFLNKRGFKKAIASAISVLCFLIIILGVFFGAGVILVSQIAQLQSKFPTYITMLQTAFNESFTYLMGKAELLPAEVLHKLNETLQTITTKVSQLMGEFLAWLFSFLTSFSSFIVNFGIAIILAYFLSVEIGTWRKFAKEKTPNTFKQAFAFLRDNVFKGIAAYLKAQFKLISVTFIMVFIAMLLLNVGNAFTIALLSALFDLLPLLGIPVIFIPWAIYLFVIGDTWLAVWLLVVLAVVMITRQILEPKITGNSLGVSAFTMLSCMIISLSLFGVAGLILSPVLLILIKALMDQGYLKSWIRLPKEEFETPPSKD